MTPDDILTANNLHPPSTKSGRYYTTCPQCSANRSNAHQRLKCLGINIDEEGVNWGCNHCGWTGGRYYNGRRNEQQQPPIIYPYYDEIGELLFEVCRFPGKKFRQRKPDGHGGYAWNTKDVRKVLFRLPGLIEAIANQHIIAVPEGEKDVLNLVHIGMQATCNPGGASEPGKKSKWRPEYSEMLRGADAVILPDHDDPGYAHAEAIAKMLLDIAKRIRILRLADPWPECPKGGDVSDWLAAGHTREELDELIARAPEVRRTAFDDPPIGAGDPLDPDPDPKLGAGDDLLPKPELLIDWKDLTKTAKQLAAMFAQHRRFLFNGHAPIQGVQENDEMPRAVTVTPDAVRVFAREICTPVKWVKDGEAFKKIRTTLTKDIANLYLLGLVGRWRLRPFNGITTAPILNNDGSFRTNTGYDEATGLWCHDIPDVQVPERPTKAQAKASLDALRYFFRTFAFADAETIRDDTPGVNVINPNANIGLDESSFLVSLMTGVCRASLPLAPGILADAPAISGAGTGKGLGTKSICIVASGATPSAFTSGHDEGEFDKRLSAARWSTRVRRSSSIISTPKISGRTSWRPPSPRTLARCARWGTRLWSNFTRGRSSP
jgi:hypothetical protein